MIKRIDLTRKHSFGYLGWFSDHDEKAAVQVLEQKINEIIDYINHNNREYENIHDVIKHAELYKAQQNK